MNQQQKGVHYFPGHMQKALRSLSSYMSAIDFVIELADARAPLSSRNPLLDKLIGSKPRLLFLSKTDRADAKVTEEWIAYFRSIGLSAIASNLKQVKALPLIEKASEPLLNKKREKEKKLGMKPQPVRLLIAGVPNVGKSTLINNLAGKSIAVAGNKPGVTRAEQWIKLKNGFILLDTPGILPSSYLNRDEAVRLALTGSIKEEVLPIDDLASILLDYLRSFYPQNLAQRYDIASLLDTGNDEILSKIAQKKGFLLQGGIADLDKAALTLIKEFKDGEYGPISLERPNA